MEITKLSRLTEDIIRQIRAVEAVCQAHDHLQGTMFLDTSLNFDPNMKTLFLLYKEDTLVSVLALFVPSKTEAEVSAYTLPDRRRKGYFKELLDAARTEMVKFGVPDLLFVCESNSEDGKKAIEAMPVDYDFSEYLLRYCGSLEDAKDDLLAKVKLYEAKEKDLEDLVWLSREIFNNNPNDARRLIANAIESKSRIQYIAKLGDIPIGMGNAAMEADETSIFGFGVTPPFQGKGYGGTILRLILLDLKNRGRGKITLEVDSTNDKAYRLYQKCGFQMETAFDYFRKKVLSHP